MSATGQELVGSGVVLLPHQASFVEKCLSTTGLRLVVLKGDAGLGKSRALAVLMSRWQRERADARILLLAPAALRMQFVEMLRHEDAPSLLVDRYQFREMLDSESDAELWPRSVVVVMSLDFAKQTDVLDSLTSTHWNLLVVDEAHLVRGERAEAVRRLSEFTERVVLAAGADFQIGAVLPGLESTTVEWRRDSIVNHDGTSVQAYLRPSLHEVGFTLSAGEVGLLKTVEDLSRVWKLGDSSAERVAASLMRSVQSSPIALETQLRQILDGMSPAAHAAIFPDAAGDDSPEGEADGPAEGPAEGVSREKATALATRALQEIEVIDRDSKLAALGNLLAQLRDSAIPGRHICVLTEYVSTLFYLAAGMEDSGFAYQLLHGEMVPEERHSVLSSFVNSGGILAATTAVVKGIELPVTTDLVLYDIPSGRVARHVVLGRFDRVGRQGRLNVHVLTPLNQPYGPAMQALETLREELTSGLDDETDSEEGGG